MSDKTKLSLDLPKSMLCIISEQIMKEPVITADGYTYEKEAIEEWLLTHDNDPQNQEPLPHKNLTPNRTLKSDIEQHLMKHPELYDGDKVYLPRAWQRQLIESIRSNQIENVRAGLARDPRLLTIKIEGDYTAFHLACEFGSPELTNFLLEQLKLKNKMVVTTTRPAVFNPIHLNTALEQSLIARDLTKSDSLLKLGANIEQPDLVTQNTLLQRMITRGESEAVAWLVNNKATITTPNLAGNTALHTVAQYGNALMVKSFLSNKVTVENINLVNAALETPLYIAARAGFTDIMQLLLQNNANPIARCGAEQKNVLHVVAGQGDLERLRLLLANKVVTDNINLDDVHGNTALHVAVQAKRNGLIPLLLEAGADHKFKNHEDRNPIELARQLVDIPMAQLIENTARGLKRARLAKLEAKLVELTPFLDSLKIHTHRYRADNISLGNCDSLQYSHCSKPEGLKFM